MDGQGGSPKLQEGGVGLPTPPRELLHRIGGPGEERDDEWLRSFYESSGRMRKEAVVRALPGDYSFEDRRVLDFGCGAGRVLRQFHPETEVGEFWGCDLHAPTIAWLDRNLSPPFHFYVNDSRPMPHDDAYFDLVYAISVFTHITHDWSAWLLELHRILKPDGFLFATIVGPEAWAQSLSRPLGEDELGMCSQKLGQAISVLSGPRVLHSPWWLREHWGRAFDIVALETRGFAAAPGAHKPGQGYVLGRKKDLSLTRDDLERANPEDPREIHAQREQLIILEEEAVRTQQRLENQQIWLEKQSAQLENQRRMLAETGLRGRLRRAVARRN